MSAVPPIADKMLRCRECPLCANNDLLRCKKKRAFSPSVGVGHSGYGAQFKEAELCSRHLGRWVRIGNWCPASGHASFGFGQGCLDGGRERQSDFHVMDLGDCIGERRRFPVGENPTRQLLQPEATGAVMEVTKWLKPSDSVSRNTMAARVCRP